MGTHEKQDITGLMKAIVLALKAMAMIAIKNINDATIVIVEGESGSLFDDEEMMIDFTLNCTARGILEASNLSLRSIRGEGFSTTEYDPKGLYDIKVDPLDASLYYKHKGVHKGVFPFGGVITVVQAVGNPTFDNIIAAAICNYVSGDMWCASAYDETTINGHTAVPYSGELSLTQIPVIAEMYYPENRERIVKAFAGQKGYLRSPGCAGVEMAAVSSGLAAAFICISQKGHELGAAYLILKRAGGVVVDWEGCPLAKERYIFDAQYPVILACNQEIADRIVELLQEE